MWKEEYKVGIELIDSQHKELFEKLEGFIIIARDKEISWEDRLEKVQESLDFLKGYVEFHFDEEEKLQEEIGYPDIEEHKIAHKDFKAGINSYVKMFEEGEFTEEKIQEFSAKLMTWLIMHVGYMDQRIGKYMKEKGEI